MLVELSPPVVAGAFVVMVIALVAGVVRGSAGVRHRNPVRALDVWPATGGAREGRWPKLSGEDSNWFLGRNDVGDYMHRWIAQTPWFTLRVHHILRSDESRALHDHPWDFVSLLVSGGYTEITERIERFETDEGPIWKPVVYETRWPRWSLVMHEAEDAHRLVIDEPVWTLVLTGPKVRRWGFWIPAKGWTYWRDAQAYWSGVIGGGR